MLVLALEASTSVFGVALWQDGRLLTEHLEAAGQRALGRLLPLVAQTLEAAGRGKGEVGGLAVGIGPGSFTGLRIALATAKGLAEGLDVPVAGVPTLEAIAFQTGPSAGLVLPLLDARQGRVYAALYRWVGAGLEEVEAPSVRPAAGWWDRLAGEPSPAGLTLAGDGLDAYGDEAARRLGPGARLAPPAVRPLRPGAVAALGARRLAAGQATDPLDLAPIYLGGSVDGATTPGRPEHA